VGRFVALLKPWSVVRLLTARDFLRLSINIYALNMYNGSGLRRHLYATQSIRALSRFDKEGVKIIADRVFRSQFKLSTFKIKKESQTVFKTVFLSADLSVSCLFSELSVVLFLVT